MAGFGFLVVSVALFAIAMVYWMQGDLDYRVLIKVAILFIASGLFAIAASLSF
jgi:hypothetical protein